jgi:hypothetical protein
MSNQPIIGKTEDGRILTPQQLRKQECKIKINQLCQAYGYALVPVVQILGSNMTTSVELAEIVAPVADGNIQAPEGGKDG